MNEPLYKKRKPKNFVNIVPLVDVLIVLIFFFLMSMQFRNETMLDIMPPEMETAGQEKIGEPTVISVNKEGEYFFNNTLNTREELLRNLNELGKEAPARPILLLADEESALKHMTTVIDFSRKAGLEQVRLQVR